MRQTINTLYHTKSTSFEATHTVSISFSANLANANYQRKHKTIPSEEKLELLVACVTGGFVGVWWPAAKPRAEWLFIYILLLIFAALSQAIKPQ